jgi:hypothetical protein
MKKIGIFAIGAILFVTVSCNKDKTQLEPSTSYSTNEQNTSNTNHYGDLVPGPEYTLSESGSATKVPGTTRPHNENEFPIAYNPNKMRPDGVRDDEVVNPYNGNTERIVKPRNFQNENEYPTFYNPQKKHKIGVRNDELINSNTSDL